MNYYNHYPKTNNRKTSIVFIAILCGISIIAVSVFVTIKFYPKGTKTNKNNSAQTLSVEQFIPATPEDFEEFEEMLGSFTRMNFSEDFDLEKLTTKEILEERIAGLNNPYGTYTYFFGSTLTGKKVDDTSVAWLVKDPENRYQSALKLEADKVDLIVKSYFGKEPVRDDISDKYYFKDDFFYIECFENHGQEAEFYSTIIDKQLLDDGSYGIAVLQTSDMWSENEYDGANIKYYVCKLKEDKELGRFWTIVKGSRNTPCFELPKGTFEKSEMYTQYRNEITNIKQYYEDNDSPKEWSATNIYQHEYTLFDINKDNIPELIVTFASCEGDKRHYVFTFKNNKSIYCGSLEGWHSGLCTLDNDIYLYGGQAEFVSLRKLILKNEKITETEENSNLANNINWVKMSPSNINEELVNKVLDIK